MPPAGRQKRKRTTTSESESNGTAFEWLLSTAITPNAFFAEHWEREPLFAQFSGSAASRYDRLAVGPTGTILNGTRKPLFDTARLLEIARDFGPLELGQQLQVMRVGDHGRELAVPPDDGRVSVSWLQERLDEGFTVQLFQPQHWCDRLWALLGAMEAELGCLCGCSVYHTPAGCQGLAAHHDDVEVFILQTEGRKRWKLYPAVRGHALPAMPSADLADEELEPCMLDITLTPGDLLYLPRGVVHQAVSLEGSASTHLTLSAYQRHAWSDLLGIVLPRLLERASHVSLDLRRGLPVHFLAHAGSAVQAGTRGTEPNGADASHAPMSERQQFEEGAGAALQRVLEMASSPRLVAELAHEAADEIGADFMQNRLPPYRPAPASGTGQLSGHATGPPPSLMALGDELEVRLCAPTFRRLVLGANDEEEFVQVQHCLANRREAHMTRAKGATKEMNTDESDDDEREDDEEGEGKDDEEGEGEDESEDDEEEGGEGGDESEDEEEEEDGEGGDEDDEEGDEVWRRLVFPRVVLATLLQLDEAYPRWTRISQLRKPKRRGLPHLQAMLTSCWDDGVLETRLRAAPAAQVEVAFESVPASDPMQEHAAPKRGRAVKQAAAASPAFEQACGSGHLADKSEAWETAVTWVREHGGSVEGINLDHGMSGVEATRTLGADTRILRIPCHLCISAKVARVSTVGQAAAAAATACAAKLFIAVDDAVLAFHLAADAYNALPCRAGAQPALSSSSTRPFHLPYYATLPSGADDPRTLLPRCWADVELDALLTGSKLAAEARRARVALSSDYKLISARASRLAGHLPEGWPSLEAYDWAAAMVASRAFSLQSATGEALDAMVPLADMLNHGRPRETSYSIVNDAVEMRMVRQVAGGNAVHDTYGAKGNAQLLSTYGFTTLPNCEPDGSSNDVRDLLLPQHPNDAAAPTLVHVPPASIPIRMGPRRYALHPLMKAIDAFRVAAHAAWEARAVAGSKKLQGAALEVRALRGALRALDAELDAYALDDHASAEATRHAPPAPAGASAHWARRAAAAGTVVLGERCTLRFYRLIISICLEVLMPATDESGALEDATKSSPNKRRRAAATRLRLEVEQRSHGDELPPYDGDAASVLCQQATSRVLAAPIALAFVQIRFPALLKKMAN